MSSKVLDLRCVTYCVIASKREFTSGPWVRDRSRVTAQGPQTAWTPDHCRVTSRSSERSSASVSSVSGGCQGSLMISAACFTGRRWIEGLMRVRDTRGEWAHMRKKVLGKTPRKNGDFWNIQAKPQGVSQKKRKHSGSKGALTPMTLNSPNRVKARDSELFPGGESWKDSELL